MSALPDWAVQAMIHEFRQAVGCASESLASYGKDVLAGYALPHVTMRPSLQIDGDHWCALYGTNLQDGVAGFGKSPALAMADFDRAWLASLPAKEGRA